MAKDAKDRGGPKVGRTLSKSARVQSAERASGRRMARGIGLVVASLLAFVAIALLFEVLESDGSTTMPTESEPLLPPSD